MQSWAATLKTQSLGKKSCVFIITSVFSVSNIENAKYIGVIKFDYWCMYFVFYIARLTTINKWRIHVAQSHMVWPSGSIDVLGPLHH